IIALVAVLLFSFAGGTLQSKEILTNGSDLMTDEGEIVGQKAIVMLVIGLALLVVGLLWKKEPRKE
ncbi:MAG TPA: hypothetical protein VMS79_02560, partial [Methanomassiliicoccales archaeon]|nr:hypothetical protein [Methanomassiliicoccales archaeon]